MKIFISYSHDDKAWVNELWRALRDRAYHDAWIDQRLVAAQDWWETILQNIEACECFIYIMSPQSISSIYCRTEIEYAIALNKPIIPLMLKTCSYPANLKSKRIQYQSINDETTLGDTLFIIERALGQIREKQHRNEYKLPSLLPVPPDEPQLKNDPQQAWEVFTLAEEASKMDNMSLAEKLFQQVIDIDPYHWGAAATKRISEIRLEHSRNKDYTNIVHMAEKPSMLKDAQAAWQIFVQKYGQEYDPDSLASKLFNQHLFTQSDSPTILKNDKGFHDEILSTKIGANFHNLESKETFRIPIKSKLFVGRNTKKINLKEISISEIITQTPHSTIGKCLIEDQYYILKRTTKEICDEEALIYLVNNPIKPNRQGIPFTFANPLVLWVTDEHIWELHPYYEGISLSKLIRRNKYHIQGDLLSDIFKAIFSLLLSLAKAKILHRDINPTNLLWLGKERGIVLIDPTFACKQTAKQIPVGNKEFAPPEQFLGEASIKSELYSFAATIYFCGNGEPPPLHDLERLKFGIDNLQLPGFKSMNYGYGNDIIRLSLDKDASKRPSDLMSLWPEVITDVYITGMHPVLGILDLDQYGYLVEQTKQYQTLNTEELSNFLEQAVEQRRIPNDELTQDAEAFLKGENPWLSI